MEGWHQWQKGVCRSYKKDGPEWITREAKYESMTWTEYHGNRPNPDDYMPQWSPQEAMHIMMYENTTEGTPISPAFATPEELARWLTDNEASAFAGQTATYEQWLATCKRGWATSAVIAGGTIESGVSGLAKMEGDKEGG